MKSAGSFKKDLWGNFNGIDLLIGVQPDDMEP
jgi:hypothetical protein